LNGSADGGIQQKFYCFIFCHLKMNKATKKVFYIVSSLSLLMWGHDYWQALIALQIFSGCSYSTSR
jgi:hypothetical protein